jgi:site-specific DNA recombinase
MTERQVALYARVSSEQQAEANTIDSQVAALQERIVAAGVELRSVLEFIERVF